MSLATVYFSMVFLPIVLQMGSPSGNWLILVLAIFDLAPQILLQGHSVDATVLRIILLAAHCQGGGVAEDEARA